MDGKIQEEKIPKIPKVKTPPVGATGCFQDAWSQFCALQKEVRAIRVQEEQRLKDAIQKRLCAALHSCAKSHGQITIVKPNDGQDVLRSRLLHLHDQSIRARDGHRDANEPGGISDNSADAGCEDLDDDECDLLDSGDDDIDSKEPHAH